MTSVMLSKVLVYLKHPSGTCSPANFKQCIFEQLGFKGEMTFCKVKYKLENNRLLLAPSANEQMNESPQAGYLLRHPQFCPAFNMSKEDLASLSEDLLLRGVNVGVAVLLESSDNCVFVTKRATHMRTFPGVWVPPGGHVELDETLEAAGLREVQEETGLEVSPSVCVSSRTLGLWESIYPPLLGYGLPKRHHIVVYMHFALNKSSVDLNKELKLNPDEVNAAIWLPTRTVESVTTGSDLSDYENLEYTQVDENGEHTVKEMDSSLLKEKMPPPGADPERISTGTRFALQMWLEEKKSKTTSAVRSSL